VTERPALSAVLFDAGGTLVRLDFEWMSEWLAAQGHIVDAPALRIAEVAGRRRYDESITHGARAADVPDPPLGRVGDTRAYFAGMLAAAGVPLPLLEKALGAFLERQRAQGLWSRPVEGAREVLDALPASGLRIACVSNSDGRAEWHLERCGVLAGLEFVVDSQIVGVEKPDPAIFTIALERLGLPAERALYVGLDAGALGYKEAGRYRYHPPWPLLDTALLVERTGREPMRTNLGKVNPDVVVYRRDDRRRLI